MSSIFAYLCKKLLALTSLYAHGILRAVRKFRLSSFDGRLQQPELHPQDTKGSIRMHITPNTAAYLLVLILLFFRLPLTETKAAADEKANNPAARKNTSCCLSCRTNYPFMTGLPLIGEFGRSEKHPELSSVYRRRQR